MHKIALSLILLGTLAACVADGPYEPGVPPGLGLQPSSYRPPVRPGCENSADQTARYSYENLRDNEDSFGVQLLDRQRAENEGRRAYQRCLAGQTN